MDVNDVSNPIIYEPFTVDYSGYSSDCCMAFNDNYLAYVRQSVGPDDNKVLLFDIRDKSHPNLLQEIWHFHQAYGLIDYELGGSGTNYVTGAALLFYENEGGETYLLIPSIRVRGYKVFKIDPNYS